MPKQEPAEGRPHAAFRYRATSFPLIQRYIVWEVLPPLVIALLLFCLVMMGQTLLTAFRDILGANIGGGTVLRFLLCLVPWLVVNTASFALLLAVLVGYGRLTEDREFIAAMAAGISPRHLIQPTVVIGLVLCLILAYGAHVVAPRAVHIQNQLLQSELERIAQTAVRDGFNSGGGLDLYVRRSDGRDLGDVVIARTGRDDDAGSGGQRTVVVAPVGSLHYDGDDYVSTLLLEGGTVTFAAGGAGCLDISFEALELRVDIARGVRRLLRKLSPDRYLSTPELRETIGQLRRSLSAAEGDRKALWRAEYALAERSSMPAGALVFALFAAPLGVWAGVGRRPLAVLLALGISFAYFLLQTGCSDLAEDGLLPATFAAWTPNGVFALIGAVFAWFVSRR